MPEIGHTEGAAVVRTDFSDDETWRTVSDAMLAETPDGFRAHVEVVDDPSFDGLGADSVRTAAGDDYPYGFVILVDRESIVRDEHPVLVVDLRHEPGRAFRALPVTVQSIDNNLTLANMDFFEFADSVDEDGVFRGFG
jgi:hypothetical protein